MSKRSLLYVMVIAAAFVGNAEAVYKCTTSKGVVYQDHPCIVGTETDLQLVVPTGQVAPTALSTESEASQVNGMGTEGRSAAARANHAPSGNNVAAAGKSGAGDKSASSASRASVGRSTGYPSNVSGASATSDSRGSSNYPVDAAMAEQLQNTQPQARYFTVDGAAPGMEMPESMNCESPNGDKRRFFFANGKLSSI